jgi:hypothetical protein
MGSNPPGMDFFASTSALMVSVLLISAMDLLLGFLPPVGPEVR